MMKVTVNFEGKDTYFSLNNTNDYIENFIKESGTFYELGMLNDIRSRVDDNATIIDVGAYIGNHSIFFGTHCSAGKVFCFEPVPDSFKKLEKNLELNLLDEKVQAFNVALGASNEKGEISFADSSNSGMNKVKKTKKGSIQITSMDDLLFSKLDRVDVIKIDVEGMELEVLKGASRIIDDFQPLLYVESFEVNHLGSIRSFLEPRGYRVIGLFNNTPTYLFAHSSYTDKASSNRSLVSDIKKYLFSK